MKDKIRVGDIVASREFPELVGKVAWVGPDTLMIRRFSEHRGKRVFSEYETRVRIADSFKVEGK